MKIFISFIYKKWGINHFPNQTQMIKRAEYTAFTKVILKTRKQCEETTNMLQTGRYQKRIRLEWANGTIVSHSPKVKLIVKLE